MNLPGIKSLKAAQGPLLFGLALGLAITLNAAPLPPGQAELVLSLAPGNSPEGIAIDDDGTIYFSNRRVTNEGLVSEIIRIGDNGKRSMVTTKRSIPQ